MLKRLMNLPFTVASRAAKAYQEHEDAKVREKFGYSADPGAVAVGSTQGAPAPRSADGGPVEGLVKPAAEVIGWLKAKRGVELVDVRTAAERAASPGLPDAVHMPMDSISVRVSELSHELPVIVYCADGRQSVAAVRFFRERGQEETWALTGGLAAWTEAGGPVARG